MEPNRGTPDPQWDFTLLIRAELERYGRYVTEVDKRDAQALADIHWAARQAGRLLGVNVKVDLSEPFGHAGATVTATVRCVQTDDEQRRLAEVGLQQLLESVRATQGRTRVGATLSAPRPRSPEGNGPGRGTASRRAPGASASDGHDRFSGLPLRRSWLADATTGLLVKALMWPSPGTSCSQIAAAC